LKERTQAMNNKIILHFLYYYVDHLISTAMTVCKRTSTVMQAQAATAARWRNTTLQAAPPLLYGRAGHLSLFLLCFSFTHTPYYMTEH